MLSWEGSVCRDTPCLMAWTSGGLWSGSGDHAFSLIHFVSKSLINFVRITNAVRGKWSVYQLPPSRKAWKACIQQHAHMQGCYAGPNSNTQTYMHWKRRWFQKTTEVSLFLCESYIALLQVLHAKQLKVAASHFLRSKASIPTVPSSLLVGQRATCSGVSVGSLLGDVLWSVAVLYAASFIGLGLKNQKTFRPW